MTPASTIATWLDGMYKNDDYTHMIVVCDTYDYTDYPVFVTKSEDVREVEKRCQTSMQRVMEVYSKKYTKESQLKQHRAFNYD